jgi:hypothetical protein
MLKSYYAAAVFSAVQFAVGMAPADAAALCTALNQGRDVSKNDFAVFNGSVIFIMGPSHAQPLTAEPGNWIVIEPSGSMDVHADADFQASFVAK